MEVSGQRHSPAALYLWERAPGTDWIGGWVGLLVGLGPEATGEISKYHIAPEEINL
jgi:hypothetical protein